MTSEAIARAKSLTLTHVRHSLRAPLPGLNAQLQMAPPHRPNTPPPVSPAPRHAGVLLLLYPKNGELTLVLTRRTDTLAKHSGQVSLPGGGREAGDPDETATALREAREELGVTLDDVEVLGTLTQLYVPPSHFVIHPVVACVSHPPHFHANAHEVAEIIEVPLAMLIDPALRSAEPRALASQGGRIAMTPHFHFGTHKVWGATAMVLAEFAALLAGMGD